MIGFYRFMVQLSLLFLSGSCFSQSIYRFTLFEGAAVDSGFQLKVEIENTCRSKEECSLNDAKIVFSAGNKGRLRYLVYNKPLNYGEAYELTVDVRSPQRFDLKINDMHVGTISSGVDTIPTLKYSGFGMPHWSSWRAQYYVRQGRVDFGSGDGQSITVFGKRRNGWLRRPIFGREPLQKMTNGGGQFPVSLKSVRTNFEFERMVELSKMKPIVDSYGQLINSEYEGKVVSDSDFGNTIQQEDSILDAWLSSNSIADADLPKLTGTGYYRVEKYNSFWWLVSPTGDISFYRGLSSVPGTEWPSTPVTGREHLFESLSRDDGFPNRWLVDSPWGERGTKYFSFTASNLERKYGEKWMDRNKKNTERRLKAWGFSGAGKWGQLENFPYFPVLNRDGVPVVVEHPDIFDPHVRSIFYDRIKEQIGSRINDSNVVGWSIGNEYSEIIKKHEVVKTLKIPRDFPLKRNFIDYAIVNLYDGNYEKLSKSWKSSTKTRDALYSAAIDVAPSDVESLRLFYADAYYQFLYRIIKEIDANHLYFGFWITPGWWENSSDWLTLAKHVDVIGFDRYSIDFVNKELAQLIFQANKPILVGEFSFPAHYSGSRGFGMYSNLDVEGDADSGDFYSAWLSEAVINPFCIGINWFEYRDQPITGRGSLDQLGLVIGENHAFGLVSVTDTPKWHLVEKIRRSNVSADSFRYLESLKANIGVK
ncbi:hypothetical protein [Rhodoferax aquaticus]|uniref:Glycoside hydrolase family 42 N-terminal domain-containing protein n=1 Tax=Rhodoferax aquaticus TaxID=2527691 RepID=A0A515EPF9_9BURK|nr:hypothetical protein [Rhodoferax aquaticus]QDL54554.1 hypothetical protein EXZ61_10465 [Rhodoferax aquaticus]